MTTPRDNFERYYTEKLWQLIPEVYRQYDMATGVLRAIIEIIGTHAAIARRGTDRLSDDPFIEYCDDWAVPYIGDLVGTRLINPLNVRGQRVDVASTIYYRRRNGTPRVLSMFPRDIANWDGAIVEAFRRLGRTPHRLDPPLSGTNAQKCGRLSLTPPGGFANLRSLRGAAMLEGPFEEYSRTADFRQLRGEKGRFNIPKFNVHLYRLRTSQIDAADALCDRTQAMHPRSQRARRATLRPRARRPKRYVLQSACSMPQAIRHGPRRNCGPACRTGPCHCRSPAGCWRKCATSCCRTVSSQRDWPRVRPCSGLQFTGRRASGHHLAAGFRGRCCEGQRGAAEIRRSAVGENTICWPILRATGNCPRLRWGSDPT